MIFWRILFFQPDWSYVDTGIKHNISICTEIIHFYHRNTRELQDTIQLTIEDIFRFVFVQDL